MSNVLNISNQIVLPTGLMDRLSISLIRFYQHNISPWKGFRCAHRVLHGGDSCSEAVLKLIRKGGLWQNWNSIRQQFRECGLAARILRLKRTSKGQSADIQLAESELVQDLEGSNAGPQTKASNNDLPMLCLAADCGVLGCDAVTSCPEAIAVPCACLSF